MSTAPPLPQHNPDCYYSFGPFQLNPVSRSLTKAGLRVPITSKALEVLLALLERMGETVSRAELRAAVWGSAAIDDNNLNQCVSAIRKALGARPEEHEYILTVTGVGYRFVAPVACVFEPDGQTPAAVPQQASESAPAPAARANRVPILFAGIGAVIFALVASAWIAQRGGARASTHALPLSRNQQAVELYLEGRRIIPSRRASDLDQAASFFRASIAKDPNFALPYAWLAETYAIKVANGAASPDLLQLGDAAGNKALKLDPSLTDVHASLGLLKYARWDWKGADREYATALRLDPNNSRALMRSAMLSFVWGRFSEAESRLRRAQALDPSNGAIPGMLGELYYYERRYDDAIRQADHILQFDPAGAAFAWDLKARAFLQEERIPEARSAAQKHATLSPDDAFRGVMLLWLNCDRNPAKFAPAFHQILEASSGRYISPYIIAAWYARMGDQENAFRQLEIVYRDRITDLVSMRWDPAFESIRNDPRYSSLLARMGLSRQPYDGVH